MAPSFPEAKAKKETMSHRTTMSIKCTGTGSFKGG